MAIQPSRFYGGDPYAGASNVIENAFTNVGTALFGDPRVAGSRALREAQARDANAGADIKLQTIEKNRRALDAQGGLGALFGNTMVVTNPDGSRPPATQADMLARGPALIQGLVDATGASPDQIAGLFRVFGATTGDEDLTRAGYAASGANLGPDFAATTGRADAVHARNAATDKDRATAVAGIGAGATLGAARIGQEGAAAREQAARQWALDHPGPLVLGPGQDAVLPPGDTRGRPGVEGPQTVSGRPTFDTTRAAAAEGYINAGATPDEQDRRRQEIVAPTVVNAGINAESRAAVAKLAAESRVTVADAQAWSRVQAAMIRGDTNISVADAAAAARVQAALVAAGASNYRADAAAGAARDVAETNRTAGNERATITADARVAAAGARPGTTPQVSKTTSEMIDQELASISSSLDFSLTDNAAASIRQRAFQLYQTQGSEGFKNPAAAARLAIQEFSDSNPQNTRGRWGRLFGRAPLYDAPPVVREPGAPGAAALPPAPQDQGNPAAVPGVAGVPQRPANLPPGTAWNGARRQWRTPDGRLWTEDGKPIS